MPAGWPALPDALRAVDTARTQWYAVTAATRDLAERARFELAARGVDVDHIEDTLTAQGWLAARSAEQAVTEPQREPAAERTPTRDAVTRAHRAVSDIHDRDTAYSAE